MRALLDINVLIALLDTDHPFHRYAAEWLARNLRHGWASCPITQNGCVRIMAQPGYPNSVPVSEVADRLRDASAHASHRFWPDDVSLLDARLVDTQRIHGPRQTTDIYLLALAARHLGRFVSFDGGISAEAAKGAAAKHLLVLTPGH
jgi:uncharacterized protein